MIQAGGMSAAARRARLRPGPLYTGWSRPGLRVLSGRAMCADCTVLKLFLFAWRRHLAESSGGCFRATEGVRSQLFGAAWAVLIGFHARAAGCFGVWRPVACMCCVVVLCVLSNMS